MGSETTTEATSGSSAILRTMWDADQIRRRVSEMAREISTQLAGERVVALVVLSGGFFFASDLLRGVEGLAELRMDFIRLRSYSGQKSTGRVELLGELPDVDDHHVLVIEDLMDTGLTLVHLDKILKLSGARSVQYAVLIDKPARRIHPFTPDYVGFTCEADAYLVGYGMDIHGTMRELPYVAALEAR